MAGEKENITQGQIFSGLGLAGRTCDKALSAVIDEYLLGTRKRATGIGRAGRGCFGVGATEVINWGLNK